MSVQRLLNLQLELLVRLLLHLVKLLVNLPTLLVHGAVMQVDARVAVTAETRFLVVLAHVRLKIITTRNFDCLLLLHNSRLLQLRVRRVRCQIPL